VRLEVFAPNHYEWAYAFLSSLDTERSWSNPASVMSRDEFVRWVHDGVFLQFTIVLDGRPVGLMRSYGVHWRDSTVRVAGAVEESIRGTGVGLLAFGRLLDATFGEGAFRKIYFEATKTAIDQYWRVAGEVFEVEGRLRQHQWTGKDYEDVLVCGLMRHEWVERRQRYAKLLDR
jgi:RimJ/RimL family protein N-acetyltransferase